VRTRTLLPVFALFAAILLLGACSSGSKTKTVASTPKNDTSSAQNSTGLISGTSTDDTGSVSSDSGKQFTGDSDSAFCNTFRKYDSYFSDNTDEADSEAKLLTAFKDLKDKAPKELKDDLQTIIDFTQELSSIDTNDSAAEDSIDSSQLGIDAQKAYVELTQYLQDVCGVEVS
jgi:hypothetical protein